MARSLPQARFARQPPRQRGPKEKEAEGMKRLLFVILALALLLFFAREADQPVQRVKGVDPPVLRVTVGELLVYEGHVGEWRNSAGGIIAAYPTLEDLAERMEYDTVSQTQAKYSFTLPPNGISLRCYQYIDGKLIPGETTLSEADGTLELLPGRWIWRWAPMPF